MPQADDGVTLTRPLRREDGRLDPARPAVELERQVRAYQPWPGSYLETAAAGAWSSLEATAEAGASRRGIVGPLARRDGLAPARRRRLELLEVQPAGGRPMSGAELAARPARRCSGERRHRPADGPRMIGR